MNEDLKADTLEIEGKYLTFNLMEEFYGVSVDWILQIIGITDTAITKIPKTPHFVKGVVNLRGKIIPVIDLRLRFKLPAQDYNERTSIVIIKMKTEKSELYIGIIVDNVLEVLDIHSAEIEQTPSFGVDLDTHFILGMAKVKNKVVSLLNMKEVLTNIELQTEGVVSTQNEPFKCPIQNQPA
ncbi:MAG: chemotaxis protein CheW [Candidatus Cloacimonetes bacterium]|nr:chemotaxis protein CheW [Candidatus Cloacimonadota bacterium]